MKLLALFFLFFGFVTSFANGRDIDHYFEQFIKQYESNPSVAMNTIPPRFNGQGRRVHPPVLLSRVEDFIGQSLPERMSLREKIMHQSPARPLAIADGRNEISHFFSSETRVIRSAEQIAQNWSVGRLSVQPWSGDYWGTYRGGIGARYNDPKYPKSYDYADYYRFYKNSLPLVVNSEKDLERLSPAEKYDLLMGDIDMSMTRWTFEDAYKTYRANGNRIEVWFGLCHGWAPAAMMSPRPQNAFSIPVQVNHQTLDLKFYPDDVKALQTLLWANGSQYSYFLGGRCDEKNPARDENGRVIDEKCFDINPGAYHLALTNQMGVGNGGVVLDVTYDYEVWNQPLVSYSIKYFHPQTKKTVDYYSEAVIPIQDYTNDKFKRYRSSQAKFIVGAIMEITYSVENTASSREQDSDADDNLRMVQYIYDLELNQRGEIIGGEWYQNSHPDFIWTPPYGARAASIADHEIQGEWSGRAAPPVDWLRSAKAAAGYGQPLSKVVETLIQLSRRQ